MGIRLHAKVISKILLTIGLLSLLVSCGGGTSGSGGITVDGRLLTQANLPVEGVTVTDLSSGDADITDASGVFGLVAAPAAEIGLLFEGQGLSTSAQISDVPVDATRVSATFRVRAADNTVAPEDVTIEQRPASSSSSSRPGSSSSASSSSASSDSSEDDSSASSVSSEDDDSSSSGDDDDNDSSSSSSEDESESSSSNSSETGEVRRSGAIQNISASLVRVGDVDFIPQASTRYEDEDGDDTTLSGFVAGEEVEARGRTSGGQVLLERLRKQS